jgi:hypothetical protein
MSGNSKPNPWVLVDPVTKPGEYFYNPPGSFFALRFRVEVFWDDSQNLMFTYLEGPDSDWTTLEVSTASGKFYKLAMLTETYFVNWFPTWMGFKYQKIEKTNSYPAMYHTWSIYLGYFEIRRWIFG